MRHKVLENRCLHGFTFGCGFDHKIGWSQLGQGQCGRDTLERFAFRLAGDFLARDLAFQVFVDQGKSVVQSVAADVVHQNVIACQRKDMRDPIPHLSGTNYADFFDVHAAPLRCWLDHRRCARVHASA